MVSANTIQKVIHGVTVCYDTRLDVIYQGEPSAVRVPFTRTQLPDAYDLCAEITTWCNFSCRNCFSQSSRGKPGIHLPYERLHSILNAKEEELIRLCITGGEPLMHPQFSNFLDLPKHFPSLGYVVNTNGSLRPESDEALAENNWLVAISLHGHADAHNAYAKVASFDAAKRRIESLAPRATVHIYCVIHNALTLANAEWLIRFRASSGAAFLRFIVSRPFGRYAQLEDHTIVDRIADMLDEASAIKISSSNTLFLGASGLMRKSS